jgi:hypothetical protein
MKESAIELQYSMFGELGTFVPIWLHHKIIKGSIISLSIMFISSLLYETSCTGILPEVKPGVNGVAGWGQVDYGWDMCVTK